MVDQTKTKITDLIKRPEPCDNIDHLIHSQITRKRICKVNIHGFTLDGYQKFNPNGYTILCNLGETCQEVTYFPKTATVILDANGTSNLLYNFQNHYLPNLATDLQVTKTEALSTSVDFFQKKEIRINPTGIQGSVYRTMQGLQNYIPMASLTKAVSSLRTTGVTGLGIITNAPLTFVGTTYIGAMFFAYCGGVAGNNSIGAICNGTSYVLSRPMKGVEVVVNGLVLNPVSGVVGLPMMLNGTDEMTSGMGISVRNYSKVANAMDRITNSSWYKKVKEIYKICRRKDN